VVEGRWCCGLTLALIVFIPVLYRFRVIFSLKIEGRWSPKFWIRLKRTRSASRHHKLERRLKN
jgi:hypothetical protein